MPGVAHFAPSVAPLAQTKPARISSSPQRTLSVPVTTRIAGVGPGSPFGPAGPPGPGGPRGPCGPGVTARELYRIAIGVQRALLGPNPTPEDVHAATGELT